MQFRCLLAVFLVFAFEAVQCHQQQGALYNIHFAAGGGEQDLEPFKEQLVQNVSFMAERIRFECSSEIQKSFQEMERQIHPLIRQETEAAVTSALNLINSASSGSKEPVDIDAIVAKVVLALNGKSNSKSGARTGAAMPCHFVSVDDNLPKRLPDGRKILQKTNHLHPRDCADVQLRNPSAKSGVFVVQPESVSEPFEAYCDLENQGGGWTVFQRRYDGSVSFDRNWEEYKEGFGNFNEEFWLGNEKISAITFQDNYTARFDIADFEGHRRYAMYLDFNIAAEWTRYRLGYSRYQGNVGSSLTSNQDFQANDTRIGSTLSCGTANQAGWWFGHDCRISNLNGLHHPNSTMPANKLPYNALGITWFEFRGSEYSLASTSIKMRPATFEPGVY